MDSGLYTIEDIANIKHISVKSAYNVLTKLRKQNLVERGGKIYKIHTVPLLKDNGMYSFLDKTPVKMQREFIHQVHGKKYLVEDAIVDCLLQKENRYLIGAIFLCNRISHWSDLVKKLKKHNLLSLFKSIYLLGRESTRVRSIPVRYKKILDQVESEKITINKNDVRSYL